MTTGLTMHPEFPGCGINSFVFWCGRQRGTADHHVRSGAHGAIGHGIRTWFFAGCAGLYHDLAPPRLEVDLKVDIDGVRDHQLSESASDSGHVWDAIVGIKGEVTLNEKWYLPFYADIGTGDSDSTYNLFGGFGYRFSRVDLIAGWRYLRWNFDDNPALKNLYISGPLAGVKIRF